MAGRVDLVEPTGIEGRIKRKWLCLRINLLVSGPNEIEDIYEIVYQLERPVAFSPAQCFAT